MVKKEEYQNKLLSDVYSKEQILAVAIFFFRKLDDIDFSVLEIIIRRKLGLSIGFSMGEKPLHESIDDLSDHISTEIRETEESKPIYVYSAPIIENVQKNLNGNNGTYTAYGQIFSEELYLVMKEIYEDSKELTLRRILVEPEISKLSNSSETSDIKYADRRALIKIKDYLLTKRGITEPSNEQLIKICEAMKHYEVTGDVSDVLNRARNVGYVTKKSVTITEKGRVYLLSKDYEEEVQNIINLLYGVGCAGNYLDEYLSHIYDGELHGFYRFLSKLNANDYLKYCKKMGYDDLIVEPVSDSKDHGAKVYPKP